MRSRGRSTKAKRIMPGSQRRVPKSEKEFKLDLPKRITPKKRGETNVWPLFFLSLR
jgi:hypothetical protein